MIKKLLRISCYVWQHFFSEFNCENFTFAAYLYDAEIFFVLFMELRVKIKR